METKITSENCLDKFNQYYAGQSRLGMRERSTAWMVVHNFLSQKEMYHLQPESDSGIERTIEFLENTFTQNSELLELYREAIKALQEIQAYQMDFVELAKTTLIYQVAEKEISKSKEILKD